MDFRRQSSCKVAASKSTEARRLVAARYDDLLRDVGDIVTPVVASNRDQEALPKPTGPAVNEGR
jgi:hypothetical protein